MCAGALVLVLDACASRVDSRGNFLDPGRLAEVRVGTHTREQVSEILGSPSSTAVFDQETWYYISKRTETFAFFKPELKERQVVVLRFDKEGVLSNVNTLGMENGRLIQPVQRKTQTTGSEMGIIEQVKGNLKRFRKKGQEQ